ncbi:longitudinals lacking protein, isoforms A/B/D/L-like [Apis florea]|uniref:longitudinals lacking protein, isoforms A/B/D/L-like n=1 Tax=Apis florea TaxID=7463 RepID=UPI00062950C3|nr:longitudinals lacking protein, isoforms A/B/D/L-like [Apis florea]
MLRLQTSLNRRGFPCPRCARTFHTSGGMSRHYRLECVDLPRFKCPHCDMRSKYTQAVYRHIRAKHRNMELRMEILDVPYKDERYRVFEVRQDVPQAKRFDVPREARVRREIQDS